MLSPDEPEPGKESEGTHTLLSPLPSSFLRSALASSFPVFRLLAEAGPVAIFLCRSNTVLY